MTETAVYLAGAVGEGISSKANTEGVGERERKVWNEDERVEEKVEVGDAEAEGGKGSVEVSGTVAATTSYYTISSCQITRKAISFEKSRPGKMPSLSYCGPISHKPPFLEWDEFTLPLQSRRRHISPTLFSIAGPSSRTTSRGKSLSSRPRRRGAERPSRRRSC